VPEGRVGCAEAMEPEEFFFVAFVVSLIRMIVPRKGKGNMRRRAGACMEENGAMSRSMER